MPTITVRIIGDRLAILNNGTPRLWVAGGKPQWKAYVERKQAEGFNFVWRA